jgi:CheY-like chemotaxis protein
MESLGQLTGGVAHDFNNLLAVFANAVQLLERTGQPPTSRLLEAMRRAVARGTGLTRHLLAFSRRSPVNPESIDLAAHLSGMRAMLDGSLGGHIAIGMTFAAGLWPVEVDAGELELAIVNLCVNARDAMPSGGAIAIAADNVRLEERGTMRDFVRLRLRDPGVGMSSDVLARAFEPFFTTKGVSKGSGLGLPQVYGFAQQSGGRVVIESAVGAGTTVTLLLPRSFEVPPPSAGPSEPASLSAPRSGPDRRGHVLLVEDDPEVAALTRELLTSLGFTVIRVASAEAALGALADSRSVDFVLSDVMMPGGMSGLQLARELRRRYPDLRIVLTTGYVESLADSWDGEFEVLLKPYTAESLAQTLGLGPRAETPSG